MFRSDVYKTWTLVLQIGISMIVPIFALIAIGYFINIKFGKNFMLVFVILGIAVGIRNVYVILKNYLKSMPKSRESELMKKHMAQFKR